MFKLKFNKYFYLYLLLFYIKDIIFFKNFCIINKIVILNKKVYIILNIIFNNYKYNYYLEKINNFIINLAI